MQTCNGKEFQIPLGNWKHLKKSFSHEAWVTNEAKGLVGAFSQVGDYLKWTSASGQVSIHIHVLEIVEDAKSLYIKHRSGLAYWFERVGEQNEKKAIRGWDTPFSYGRRNQKSNG